MYGHANTSGRQLVRGRCYQGTDTRTKDQMCIPDWCGVKSFTPSDERCKDLVQQEQISNLISNLSKSSASQSKNWGPNLRLFYGV